MAAVQNSPDESTSSLPSSSKSSKEAISTEKSPKTTKRNKQTHPPTASMFNTAISELNNRQGSSLYAIKKYIAANYQVDMKAIQSHLKLYVKQAVTKKLIIQTKGSGFRGSFKLPPASKKDPKPVDNALDSKKNVKPKVHKPKVPTKPKAKAVEKAIDTSDASSKEPTDKPAKEEKIKKTKTTNKPSQETDEAPIEKKTAPKRGRAAEKLDVEEEKHKSPSKVKKTRSPVIKPKTPKPKKLTGKKITKKAATVGVLQI